MEIKTVAGAVVQLERQRMDGEFSAKKTDNSITLTCHKAKDFEALNPLQFVLKPTELEWLDSDDEPMTSVYLEYKGEATTSTKQHNLSARDEAIKKCLHTAIDTHGIKPTEDIKEKYQYFELPPDSFRKIVNIDYWRDEVYKSNAIGAKSNNARRMAFNRSHKKLLIQGVIVEYDPDTPNVCSGWRATLSAWKASPGSLKSIRLFSGGVPAPTTGRGSSPSTPTRKVFYSRFQAATAANVVHFYVSNLENPGSKYRGGSCGPRERPFPALR